MDLVLLAASFGWLGFEQAVFSRAQSLNRGKYLLFLLNIKNSKCELHGQN